MRRSCLMVVISMSVRKCLSSRMFQLLEELKVGVSPHVNLSVFSWWLNWPRPFS